MYTEQAIVLPAGNLLSETKSIQVNLTYMVLKHDMEIIALFVR